MMSITVIVVIIIIILKNEKKKDTIAVSDRKDGQVMSDTLWESTIAMENHHCSWENSLLQWQFSIANCSGWWLTKPH